MLVSASGSRVPAAEEKTSQGQIGGFGRAVLQTVSALETGDDGAGSVLVPALAGEADP